ncbi:Crp/Fnr family transcriptional regulator [Tenacibaculum sp. IB213877]|uniref:Crp/Fnr family transcriptional regulator n=1 Tax=Tenacibaculum sp. IB213877 TaxID=3097351 RepID=UPI002A59DC8F|nr:cyclic nucleotide-binding domain-containing protein [Tenacibaculum sp. IB213877]MDY0780601.1 cyclic nucleotide-binding domain-containing protein [Tenacibaculum sp. IB213877]
MDTFKINFGEYLQSIINDEKLDALIPEILNSFEYLQLNRNDYFVSKGEICSHFCFIESGILQHSIEVLEEEKTTYLALKNSCTSALKSFLQKSPSRKNIKALSDCDLLVIKVDAFHHLLKNNKAFHQFYYNLIENQIFLIDDYRIDLLTLTPEERYKKLLANEPKLLQEVSLHYLASFLGISTRHMSRIRKNIK